MHSDLGSKYKWIYFPQFFHFTCNKLPSKLSTRQWNRIISNMGVRRQMARTSRPEEQPLSSLGFLLSPPIYPRLGTRVLQQTNRLTQENPGLSGQIKRKSRKALWGASVPISQVRIFQTAWSFNWSNVSRDLCLSSL